MMNEEIIHQINRGIRVAPTIVGPSNTLMLVNTHLPTIMARVMPRPSRSGSRGGITFRPAFDGGSQSVSHTLGPSSPVFLARPGARTSKEHWVSTLEEDCSNLANMTDEALKEELLNKVYYTRQAFVVLAIGGTGHWDVTLSYRHRKERIL